mmetsp:Transcript_24664/g.34286  ORF Transcript_24664/g.34286 Transcript_24664/m.34286 type:complete len:294 (-) Transcript_24664:58-939(-)
MDNIVMIMAGDLIDNTIGVKFGLATLTAAAFGQICSDVSGIAFGGVIEATATRLGLPIPAFTSQQRLLPRVKLYGTFGMICGVIIGCLLGMTSLLFLDLEAAERAKKETELTTIIETVIEHGHNVINAERASMFLLDRKGHNLWTKVATGTNNCYTIKVNENSGFVGLCAMTGRPLVVDDAYKYQEYFNSESDKKLDFRTKSVMCWPVFERDQQDRNHVLNQHNTLDLTTVSPASAKTVVMSSHTQNSPPPPKLIAVIEIINKRNDELFTQNDQMLCEMLAYHVAIFMRNHKG